MPPRLFLAALLVMGCFVAPTINAALPVDPDAAREYTETVRPFLKTYCTSCHSGEKPAAQLGGASISVVSGQGSGYSYWGDSGPHMSDANGRYQLPPLPESAQVMVYAEKKDYVQQCASPPVRMTADATVVVELVSRANLSASPNTVRSVPGFRFVSGTVYENTAAGKRHVAGAWVEYDPFTDNWAALTYTDANGRYLLCGIPEAARADIIAYHEDHRVAFVTAPAGQTTGLDIVFP
jgi:hypothetical protein